MDTSAMLAAFDRQIRRAPAPAPGDTVERDDRVVRVLSSDPGGWSGVVWAGADGSTADALITRELARFAESSRERWEWKYYGYDLPHDLPERLLAAGFEAGPAESVLVAEVADVPVDTPPPPGVRLLPVTDSSGVDLLVRAHEEVFGDDHAAAGRALAAGLADGTMVAVVALAGDRPICAARMEFHRGTAFASLWGGGTVTDWRGRGVFRAVVAYRARLAAARGVALLQVDATADSAPILRRLGFRDVTSTIPFEWSTDGRSGRSGGSVEATRTS